MSLIIVCNDNEEYTCGSICTETCDYKPTSCIKICRFGCFCEDGYVRQSNETKSFCIKREECNTKKHVPQCEENEEYQPCGLACPPTCDEFSYPLPKKPQPCTEKCCTGDNEQYGNCGSACIETCDPVVKLCPEHCIAGCFCKSEDYVRQNNSSGSTCIKREQC